MQVRNRNFFPLLIITCLLLFAMGSVAQSDHFAVGSSGSDTGFFAMSSISGTMVDGAGRPVPNGRVELHGMAHGEVLAVATTNYAGEYHINNVSRGEYEIIGQHGLSETRDRVSVLVGGTTINLRLQEDRSFDAGDGSDTVTVNDFKVPDKARKALQKARSALQDGNYQKVARYTEQALSIYPNYGDALTMRGLLSLQNHKTDAARNDLEKAIQLDSGHSLTYFLLAAAYNETGRFDDALRTLGEGIRIAPNAWQGYFEMSKALLGKNLFTEALRQASKGMELNPTFPMLHLIKGDCFLGLKDYVNAITEMQAYLDAKPTGDMPSQVRATIAKLKALMPQPTVVPPVVGNLVTPHE